jgi:hypothetical protein
MRSRLLAALLGIVAQACGRPYLDALPPLSVTPAHPPVVIDGKVARRLADDWPLYLPLHVERAYCVRYHVALIAGDTVFHVTDVIRAKETNASLMGVTLDCPTKNMMEWATLHIHLPIECAIGGDRSSCHYVDKPQATPCFASDIDYHTLVRMKRPFALLQCGRFLILPYYPDGVLQL